MYKKNKINIKLVGGLVGVGGIHMDSKDSLKRRRIVLQSAGQVVDKFRCTCITLVNVKVLELVATHWCRLNYELE